jgi:hypothetical protein
MEVKQMTAKEQMEGGEMKDLNCYETFTITEKQAAKMFLRVGFTANMLLMPKDIKNTKPVLVSTGECKEAEITMAEAIRL